jgi:hypothetical protein
MILSFHHCDDARVTFTNENKRKETSSTYLGHCEAKPVRKGGEERIRKWD